MELYTMIDYVANIITILGFPLLIVSIVYLVQQVRVQAYQAIYDSIRNIDQFLVENSDLREYLYGNKVLPKAGKERERIMAAADMLLTYFEHVVVQKNSFSKEKWKSLQDYMKDAYNSSQVLKYFLEQKKHWFNRELIQILGA